MIPKFCSLRIALAATADIGVFVGFIIIGGAEHQITQSHALVRTALPFGLSWFAIAPWLGVYKKATFLDLKKTLCRLPLVWILCASIGLMIREVFIGHHSPPVFAIIAISMQGAMLLGWRIVVIYANDALGTVRNQKD